MTMRICGLLGLVLVLALPGAAQEEGGGGDFLTIKISKELELKDFLDQISKATGKALIYDPNGQRIRGQRMGADVTTRVPSARAFDAFRSILAFYELTLIPVGPKGYESYLVMDSRSTNNLVKNKARWIDPSDVDLFADNDGLYVACAFPLSHVRNMTTVRTALSTMVSPAGIGRVHEYPGGILVMDFAPNVASISRILRQMDVEAAANAPVMEVIELEHAQADEMALTLRGLMEEPEEERKLLAQRRSLGAAPMKPRIVPYGPRNAVVIYAAKVDAARLRELVAALDRPVRSK